MAGRRVSGGLCYRNRWHYVSHERAFGLHVLGLGLGLVLLTMFVVYDVIREAEYQGHHAPIVQIGMRYGMMLLLPQK